MRNIDLKYFLYARKSSESEDRQMASIEDQTNEVKKLALKYNLQVVDIISEAKSAKEPGRVGFNSMLKRIQKGEAQGILTWKLNRLARNPIDGGQISWMLQQNIIKHIQTFERDYNPADNVLLMQVEFGMANQYVKDLSLDIRRGLRQKAERGWYPIPLLPIGYLHNHKFIPGTDNEILINPEPFKILQKLWQYLLTGHYSIAQLKRKGDIMGFRNVGGKNLSKTTYYQMFRNEFYCGYYHWKDKDGAIIRYKGKHRPVVSLDEFLKAQSILNGDVSPKARERKYNFPYRGLIKCGECGCAVTPDHKLQIICTKCKHKFSVKNRDTCPRCNMPVSNMKNPSRVDILYYHCCKGRGKCTQGAITRDAIEVSIDMELKKVSISPVQHQWALAVIKDNEGMMEKEEMDKVVAKLKKRKTDLEKRISGLIDLRADGELSSELFSVSFKRAQDDVFALGAEIERVKGQYINTHAESVDNLNFVLKLRERFKNGDDELKTQIARDLSSNLSLSEKRLVITVKNPFLEIKKRVSLLA